MRNSRSQGLAREAFEQLLRSQIYRPVVGLYSSTRSGDTSRLRTTNVAPIPTDERSPQLKSIVFELYGKFAHLMMERKVRAQILPLGHILEPWLKVKEEAIANDLQARKAAMLSFGIDGASYLERLQRVLDSDRHLRQCCGWAQPLIDHIDRHLGASLLVNLMGTSHLDEAENDWKDFIELTYAEPLKRLSYTHLFNFKTDQAPFSLGNARIERLSLPALAEILGENLSAVRFFHRPAESEYFLVFEESGWDANPRDWPRAKQQEASEVAFLLQVFKPGVVHTTYTVPFFFPSWVSSLWSRVISPSYIGTFRGALYKQGHAPYTLDGKEIETLKGWADFYQSPACKSKLAGRPNGFGQMLLRSAEYYRSSLSRERAPERLVDLAIALESMFTPSSAHTELTFRISQNVSQLIGEDAATRVEISKQVKKLYDRRSALMHGQYDYAKFARGEFVSDEEVDLWADLIRKAILRLAVLYFRGETDRETFLGRLTSAALDQSLGEKVRIESDPVAFLSRNLQGD